MQRKYLTSIILILFLSIIGTVLYFTFQKLHKKKLARDNIEYMPDISFFDIANNNHFNYAAPLKLDINLRYEINRLN